MKSIRDRVLSRTITDINGCWIFQGAITSGGYGAIGIDGKSRSTHMVMHELDKGPIPPGMEVDHLCRVRACCNPGHLEAVPQIVNWERGESPSRINALRTHCKHGHELSGENVRIATRRNRRPSRQCVACHRARNREHMRAARAA
jgi:hypothetical protein